MAPLLADHQISEFSVLAVQEPWRNSHMHMTHNPLNSSFQLFYSLSAKASVGLLVNKSFNPSSYSATFPTSKYGHLCLRSPVEGARDIMIQNVYRTRNLSPTSSENQLLDELLLVDIHEILLHVSAALSDASAHHVLLGDFNTNHPIWGGADVRPDRSSQLLLPLQELHELSLLLPPDIITFKRYDAQSTIDHVFFSSSLSHILIAGHSREDLDYGSDHYPIENSFLFSPYLSSHVSRPLWRMADKAALSLRAKELDLFPKHYENCIDLDTGDDRLVRWI